MIEPRPMTKERRGEVAAYIAMRADRGFSMLEEVFADARYWRESLRDIPLVKPKYGLMFACPVCAQSGKYRVSIEHDVACSWKTAQ